jgi:hypothetical protein
MVIAHSPSTDVRRVIFDPLQRRRKGISIQLSNRSELDRFLQFQRRMVNEISMVLKPLGTLRLDSKIEPLIEQSDDLKAINQKLLLFDLDPQPPTI